MPEPTPTTPATQPVAPSTTKRVLTGIGAAGAIVAGVLLYTSDNQLSVDVAERYALTKDDGSKRVADKYTPGQDTLTLKFAWARWKAMGMPYQTFRQTYVGCAVAMDIAWLSDAPTNIASGYQNSYSFADWSNCPGHWMANRTMPIPRGGMQGKSSFGYWNGSTAIEFATSEFEMDDADWWPANQTERRLFETPNSSLSTPDNGSYNESFRIEGFRLQGPGKYNDGITRIGLFVRRGGECCYINQVQANMFQHGFVFNGGVPVTVGTLTGFFNEKTAVALMGCWGMTFSFQTISGDQNGELLGSHPGYGDQAGGRIFGGLLKDEDGLHVPGTKNPYRWQTALYLEGQYACTIGVISTARGGITQDAMIALNPRLQDGSPQGSVLNIGSAIGFEYKTVVHNLATGERIASPGSYQGFTLRHYANGNRYVLNDQVVTPTTCNCPLLGGITGPGNYNYTACTPLKPGGTTVVPGGSWTYSAWSACTNGVQTRTVTCTGVCTDPKPAETQPCTQPPPPPPPTPTMTATVFCSKDPVDGYGSGDGSKAVDGNVSTYWLACKSMATGQEFIAALGASKTVRTVSFTKPPYYNNSYPRHFTVWTSTTGAANSYVQRGGIYTNTGNATATLPAAVAATHIKIVVGATDPNWSGNYWGIAEFTFQ